MKHLFIIALFSIQFSVFSQEKSAATQFWDALSAHCGKAYEGKLVSPESDPRFAGRLVMHVRSCEDGRLRIPFFVGDDRSRTWVLTMEGDLIKLKHDHRHEDGSEDKITQYGGTASNTGFSAMQIFPADQETTDLIPYAAGNVWWITVDETSFTYNLRRTGSETFFSVKFDLTTPIELPQAPWGWAENSN
ncbi:MAG: hypothetical protein Q8S14_12020 [Algoriphagus sp.]|uniref:hypothetical protein n=1 Tax=Algoriphagus sp. TaxID=1872435 RepID=UPI00272FC426|nr:hypothetical protein [Algoriphagus sp.]MDP2042094.1 hypothetical protein [Algoriphagus sp.]MDP3472590.1 hypothetical protein [Algoriphagus sp.]